ncbi:MAG: Uma2 family endonuclease [Planctomycetota bacterium]
MAVGQRKLTYREYSCYPDDGQRHEIIDGVHYMNPAPSTYHQTVSRRLQFQLYSRIELTGLGQVFNAPVDLQLSDHDIVQPDIVVITNDRRIITPSKIKGVPNLIVEILSPSTVKNDRDLKFSLYEQSLVDEYWIVDPFDHQVEQFVQDNGAYRQSILSESITLGSVQPAADIKLKEVW